MRGPIKNAPRDSAGVELGAAAAAVGRAYGPPRAPGAPGGGPTPSSRGFDSDAQSLRRRWWPPAGSRDAVATKSATASGHVDELQFRILYRALWHLEPPGEHAQQTVCDRVLPTMSHLALSDNETESQWKREPLARMLRRDSAPQLIPASPSFPLRVRAGPCRRRHDR